MAKTIIGRFYEIMVEHPMWSFNKVLQESIIKHIEQKAQEINILDKDFDELTVSVKIDLNTSVIKGLKELYDEWHEDNVPQLDKALLLKLDDWSII